MISKGHANAQITAWGVQAVEWEERGTAKRKMTSKRPFEAKQITTASYSKEN
jgi:hypothetical protein